MTFAEFYLTQITQLENGVTAFALAQNLTFAIAIFSVPIFRREVVRASWRWTYIAPVIGKLVYVIAQVFCLWIEMKLVASLHGPTFDWIPVSLAVGRIVGVLIGVAPLMLAMMAVRLRDKLDAARTVAA